MAPWVYRDTPRTWYSTLFIISMSLAFMSAPPSVVKRYPWPANPSAKDICSSIGSNAPVKLAPVTVANVALFLEYVPTLFWVAVVVACAKLSMAKLKGYTLVTVKGAF